MPSLVFWCFRFFISVAANNSLNKGERNIHLKFGFLINKPAEDALKFISVCEK